MQFVAWIQGHWFELLQTASILVGVFSAVHSIRADTRERKIENLFTLTSGHRDLWSKLYERPELSRVLSERVDFKHQPLAHEEELFIHTLILHLRAAFKARKLGMQFDDDAIAADIRQFFVRPIPRVVWERSKVFQDADFVSFVDSCLKPRSELERAA